MNTEKKLWSDPCWDEEEDDIVVQPPKSNASTGVAVVIEEAVKKKMPSFEEQRALLKKKIETAHAELKQAEGTTSVEENDTATVVSSSSTEDVHPDLQSLKRLIGALQKDEARIKVMGKAGPFSEEKSAELALCSSEMKRLQRLLPPPTKPISLPKEVGSAKATPEPPQKVLTAAVQKQPVDLLPELRGILAKPIPSGSDAGIVVMYIMLKWALNLHDDIRNGNVKQRTNVGKRLYEFRTNDENGKMLPGTIFKSWYNDTEESKAAYSAAGFSKTPFEVLKDLMMSETAAKGEGFLDFFVINVKKDLPKKSMGGGGGKEKTKDQSTIPCRDAETCKNTKCRFLHSFSFPPLQKCEGIKTVEGAKKVSPCRYRENCKNAKCSFGH
jgi:hypothetical protein